MPSPVYGSSLESSSGASRLRNIRPFRSLRRRQTRRFKQRPRFTT